MTVFHPGGPPPAFDAARARIVMLEVIARYEKQGPGFFQAGSILREVAKQLGGSGNLDIEQAILTLWYDLFRSGHLSPGYNLNNPDLPHCHLTDQGRETLRHASRDPANPDGYLEHLKNRGPLDPVAKSYVDEALNTYNASCFKAAAVMIGAATERIVLVIRDALVVGMTQAGRPIPPALNDWRYKTARDAITSELESQKRQMPRELAEAWSAFWTPLTEQPRTARNDAGHPVSIDPVTPDTVHASLLIFPELVGLAASLEAWIASFYV